MNVTCQSRQKTYTIKYLNKIKSKIITSYTIIAFMFNKILFMQEKRKLGKFYIYFYSEKHWTKYLTDSGNCDGLIF